jgi:hypothetical protein
LSFIVNHRIKPYVIALAVAVALSAAGIGGVELVVSRVYYPGAPAFDYPPPDNPVRARAQDLDYFRNFLDLDRSYTAKSRHKAEEILAGLEAELADLTDAGFQLGIARAVAAADNGHTNIWLGRFSHAHGRLPLRLYWFADGVYVVRAHPEYVDLLGAELIAVGDRPVLEAADALREFVGGTNEAFRAYRGPILLELPVAHQAAGQAESESEVTMTFRLPDAGLQTRKLGPHKQGEGFPFFWPHVYLLSSLPQLEPEPWLALTDQVDALPLYLQAPTENFRLADLPGQGLYIQYRANHGDGISEFEKRVRRAAAASPPRYIVLDQRFNGGGDYTLTADLMFDLPELVDGGGKVYVLTGPATFSAGINSIAFAKSTGGDRVVLVGTRVGDRERMYGETNEFELPNSALGMTFNTGLHDLADGCPPFPECYYRNYFYDVAVGSLAPDIVIETRYADFLAGRDPVLEHVLTLAY